MSQRNSSSFIPRRAMLAGMGAGAAAMFMRPLFASAADAVPTRLLIIHRPCGTRMESFFPSAGDAKNFTLPSITQSFEPLRSDMVLLNGISCPRDNGWLGDKHSAGMITMMTGKPPSLRRRTAAATLFSSSTMSTRTFRLVLSVRRYSVAPTT